MSQMEGEGAQGLPAGGRASFGCFGMSFFAATPGNRLFAIHLGNGSLIFFKSTRLHTVTRPLMCWEFRIQSEKKMETDKIG